MRCMQSRSLCEVPSVHGGWSGSVKSRQRRQRVHGAGEMTQVEDSDYSEYDYSEEMLQLDLDLDLDYFDQFDHLLNDTSGTDQT